MHPDDIANRFDYHRPDATRVAQHEQVRAAARVLADAINELVPEGREKSTAVTKVEEAMFWANAGIARAPKEES